MTLDEGPRDTTQDETAQAAPTVRADHDQITGFGFGGPQDGLDRITLPDEERGRCAFRPGSQHEGLDGNFHSGPLLIHPTDEPATRQSEAGWVDDGQHQQLRGVFVGERDGPLGGRLRSGLQVRREHDPANSRERLGDSHCPMVGLTGRPRQ